MRISSGCRTSVANNASIIKLVGWLVLISTVLSNGYVKGSKIDASHRRLRSEQASGRSSKGDNPRDAASRRLSSVQRRDWVIHIWYMLGKSPRSSAPAPPTSQPTAVGDVIPLNPSHVPSPAPSLLPPLPSDTPSAEPKFSEVPSNAPTEEKVLSNAPTEPQSLAPTMMSMSSAPVISMSSFPTTMISQGPSQGPAASASPATPSLATSFEPSIQPTTSGVTATNLTLLDIIGSDPTLSTLMTAAVTAGLGQVLGSSTGPLTVFAPNNDAFMSIGMSYVVKLLTPGFDLHLTDLLLSHVAKGEYLAADLTNGFSFTTVNNLVINTTFNGAQQVELVPPSAAQGLIPPIPVIQADEMAVNGILHVVADVILPVWYFTNPISAVAKLPQFSIVSSLITAAGLRGAAMGLVNQTIVLPNNDAFAALPNATVEYLTSTVNVDVLTKVLEYHILKQMLPYSQLPVNTTEVPTLEGESVTVNVSIGSNGKNIAFNNIPVVGQGGYFLTKDNLIYELGGVLIPPSLQGIIPTN